MRDDTGMGGRQATRLRVSLARWVALRVYWLVFGAEPDLAAELAAHGAVPICGGVDTETVSGQVEAVARWAARIWIESSR